jgi:uncharacterized protein YyaL (SSP411 family)
MESRKLPWGTLARAGARLLHPSVAALLARDALGLGSRVRFSQEHLEAALRWICRAHDECGGRGVSAGFSLLRGWFPPYPETTGYIIPTFFHYAALTGEPQYRQRAVRMADWEIEVRLPSGAVMGGVFRGAGHEPVPVVFNTGQVILGWTRAYAETREERYLAAARRAGDWLVQQQSPDGAWRLPGAETRTLVHAYDARTAWSLLEVHALTGEAAYLEAARRNLDWTVAQQLDNGWFRENAFFTESKWSLPLTHTIAYVMEGLLEAWRLVGEERYLAACRRTAEKLLRIFELRRYMAGEFDDTWQSTASFSCLTGNAQIAGVWLRLFELTRDTRFLSAALKLNDFVKATQQVRSLHPAIRGGIKGSQPIWGRYTPYTYVSWGAKFFADSLMLEGRVMAKFEAAVLSGERLGPGDAPDSALARTPAPR